MNKIRLWFMSFWIFFLGGSIVFVSTITPVVAQGTGGICQRTNIISDIQSRQHLRCGVYQGGYAGFAKCTDGSRNPADCVGFDVDFCHAVAASVLGDNYDANTSVEFVALTAEERFDSLCNGEIDMLSRVTTWTIGRDIGIDAPGELTFAPTTYYDEQGILVRSIMGNISLEELAGTSICVEAGTTTEANIADAMERYRPDEYPEKIIAIESQSQAWNDFIGGKCGAITADRSRLVAWILEPDYLDPGNPIYPSGENFTILELNEPLSEEPLGPVTVQSDPVFADVVRWTVNGLIRAEMGFTDLRTAENPFGRVTQNNVMDLCSIPSANTGSEIDIFLGRAGETSGILIGANIPNNFMCFAIAATGNYEEIFQRNLGNVNQNRGPNQVAPNGLLYSPPF